MKNLEDYANDFIKNAKDCKHHYFDLVRLFRHSNAIYVHIDDDLGIDIRCQVSTMSEAFDKLTRSGLFSHEEIMDIVFIENISVTDILINIFNFNYANDYDRRLIKLDTDIVKEFDKEGLTKYFLSIILEYFNNKHYDATIRADDYHCRRRTTRLENDLLIDDIMAKAGYRK